MNDNTAADAAVLKVNEALQVLLSSGAICEEGRRRYFDLIATLARMLRYTISLCPVRDAVQREEQLHVILTALSTSAGAGYVPMQWPAAGSLIAKLTPDDAEQSSETQH